MMSGWKCYLHDNSNGRCICNVLILEKYTFQFGRGDL